MTTDTDTHKAFQNVGGLFRSDSPNNSNNHKNDNKENKNSINSNHLNEPENDTNTKDENNNNNPNDNDTKANDNDPDCFKCPQCTFKNTHNGVLCQMCDGPLFKFNQLPQNTWHQVLQLNHNKLPTVPQWIKCIKCNKWRTIPVPISIIKTWQPHHNWSCDTNHQLINGCNTKSKIPNKSTHSSFELLALQTQRHLVCIKENNEPQRYYKELQQKIQRLMKKSKAIIAKQELQRNDAIMIIHMTLQQALELKVNDKIDHRDKVGRFAYATIKEKQGTNLRIHYEGWSVRWDIWSDFKKELYRFAKPLSISQRPAHRFKTFKKGDYIDINPLQRHPGWKCGEITKFDRRSGQIQVVYGAGDMNYLYWTHLDNKEEIAQFTSNAAVKCISDVDQDIIMKQFKQSINKKFERALNENIIGNDVIMDKHSNSKKRKLENNINNRPNKRQKVSENNNGKNKRSSPLNKLRRPSLLENKKCNTFDNILNEKYLSNKKEKRLNEEIVSLNQQIFEQKALLKEINNLMDDYKKENEELKKLTEKRLNEEIKLKHELNQKILENEGLKKNNNNLQKKLDSCDFGMDRIDTLDLDELNELRLKMQEKIKLIEETEKELMDNTYKCIACMNRAKNISFMDGCSHIALCDECEAKSISKLCPLCQTPYKNVKKINF